MRTLAILFSFILAIFADAADFKIEETDAAIVITNGEKPVLTYHKAEVDPPAEADPIYKRSGFIFPLHTPSGGVVTGIHPDDHYHHLGLWHAWVETEFDGETIDFWNLKKGTGRIRFGKTLETKSDGKSATFSVIQEHVGYLGEAKKETVILEETFTVSVSAAKDGSAYLVDYTTAQENITTKPLELPAYRYGGCLAWRAPFSWDNRTNSNYLTSEGLDKEESHTSRARWIAMHGPVDEAKNPGTLAVLIHKKNHDFPQRLRTWNDPKNGKMFLCVVPVQKHPWAIEPAKTETMRYRLVVSDGKPDAEKIEAEWKSWNEE